MSKLKTKKVGFCFFASSNFGYWSLKTILKKYKPSLIITIPPKPAGRGLKIKPNIIFSLALREKLPVIEWKNNFSNYSQTKMYFDFGLIAGFGKIIPINADLREFYTKINGEEFYFEKGILNLHPSLLPKYRGANPIQESILNGDEKTGATLFLIDGGIDTGKILEQKELILNGNETINDLEMNLGQLAGNLFNETIKKYLNNEIEFKKQNNSNATYTKKVLKSDGLLDIKESFEIWDRKIRAFQKFPTTFIKIKIRNEEKLLKIFEIEKLDEKQLPKEIQKKNIGEFFALRNELCLRISNSFIKINQLQLQGRQQITSKEFLNGYSINSIKLISMYVTP